MFIFVFTLFEHTSSIDIQKKTIIVYENNSQNSKIINFCFKIGLSKKKLEYLQFITLMLFLSHFELGKVILRVLNFVKNFFRICLRPPPSGVFSDLKMKKVENNSISRHLKQFSKEEL